MTKKGFLIFFIISAGAFFCYEFFFHQRPLTPTLIAFSLLTGLLSPSIYLLIKKVMKK